jgi:hypothetical protein
MLFRVPRFATRIAVLSGLLAAMSGFILLRALQSEKLPAQPILPGVLTARLDIPAVPAAPGPHYFCPAQPRTSWLSVVEVELVLRNRSLDLLKIRMIDDKCYLVSVRDSFGQTRDLLLHPVTAELIREIAR